MPGAYPSKGAGIYHKAVGPDSRRETAELDRANRLDPSIDEANPTEVDEPYGGHDLAAHLQPLAQDGEVPGCGQRDS